MGSLAVGLQDRSRTLFYAWAATISHPTKWWSFVACYHAPYTNTTRTHTTNACMHAHHTHTHSHIQRYIPGDSCSLTICLSVKEDRLCISVMVYLALQCAQTVGSAIRPLSISTVVVEWQTAHSKNAEIIKQYVTFGNIFMHIIREWC